LRVGDEVRLNPQLLSRDSFGSAEQRYGLVPGRLSSLSRDSVEAAATPTGLAWTLGRGPDRPQPDRTPAEVEAEVETRAPLSYLVPFWRWLSGSRP
jgi:hypothetical protein